MKDLLGNRWLRIGVGSVLMIVIGFLITAISNGVFETATTSDFAASLAYGAVPGGPQFLPLSDVDAETVGWHGSIRCHQNQGRFFRKLSGDEPDPMMLVYNQGGNLIGVNLHSVNEQPGPWSRLSEGRLGVEGRQTNYWDLGIYFVSPGMACATGTGGTGFVFHAIYP